MAIRAIDFVSYDVVDIKRSIAFYRDILGLTLAAEAETWAEFDVAGVTLGLSTYGEKPVPGYKGGASVFLSVDDIEIEVERLKSAGVELFWGPEDTGACLMAGLTDPDGNRIFLHHRKDGTAG